jgi:hypothetical protein
MIGNLFSKYIGRKFLVFLLGTLLFIFVKKFTDVYWLYVAAIYLASNVLARIKESSFEIAEDSSKLTKFIARYAGRKFLVFSTGTILYLLTDKLSAESWVILAGMYCGANVLIDFMPSIGASVTPIKEKINKSTV